MSISNVTSSPTQPQALARQIANAVDTNRDGQVSLTEFGDFLRSVLGASSTPTAAVTSSRTTASVLGGGRASLSFTPRFFGFDASRAQSAAGSLKYDAYNVLQSYDPHDPAAMRQAFTVLDAMHPGKYELDPQDNLMLTGTADGYIGARPLNRDSDWNNRNQDWGWTWFGYNTAHPGPNGEIT